MKANNKNCPICGSQQWSHDMIDGFTGWTFCGDCYYSARETNLFKKIKKSLDETLKHHNKKCNNRN